MEKDGARMIVAVQESESLPWWSTVAADFSKDEAAYVVELGTWAAKSSVRGGRVFRPAPSELEIADCERLRWRAAQDSEDHRVQRVRIVVEPTV